MKRGILIPYKRVRYHLREFGRAGERPHTAYELYNLRHSQLRNAVERTIGVLKARFKILTAAHAYPYKMQICLIYTLAGLHNFIRKCANGKEDKFYQEADAAARMSDLEANGRNSGVDLEESEGISMNLVTEESRQMYNFREMLTNQMWEDYKSYESIRGRY